MFCRNCRCDLDDGFRYCPRCGAPNSLASLAWPAAGAPWLRHPAAVGSLAFLLIAWLVALQRQLWLPGHAPATAPARPPLRVALRPLDSLPAPPARGDARKTASDSSSAPHPAFNHAPRSRSPPRERRIRGTDPLSGHQKTTAHPAAAKAMP